METQGRTILFGVVLGALTGLVAALLFNRRAENADRSTAITAGEGIQLGAMVFGLLRAIAALADTEKR